jgi:DNA repair and recombination protein RAD52
MNYCCIMILTPSPPSSHHRAVANDIFSFDRWSCELKEIKLVHCTKEDGGNRWSCAYQCHMRVSFLDAGRAVTWHEDVGYGASQQSKIDAALEVAYKGAVTDARKRCLRLFGPSLGLTVNSEAFQKTASDAKK